MKKVIICIVAIIAMSLSTANAAYRSKSASAVCRVAGNTVTSDSGDYWETVTSYGMFYLNADASCSSTSGAGAMGNAIVYSYDGDLNAYAAYNWQYGSYGIFTAGNTYHSESRGVRQAYKIFLHAVCNAYVVGVYSSASASISW